MKRKPSEGLGKLRDDQLYDTPEWGKFIPGEFRELETLPTALPLKRPAAGI
jgi:hypothetical protein